MKSNRIAFDLDWRDIHDGVDSKTLASITLLIDDIPVWPVTGERAEHFELYVDDLLSHLAECWKPLILRQTYPIPVQPLRPSFLLADAERRWSNMPDAAAEVEREQIAAFEDAHNIANAFGGITGLLPLWFIRASDDVIVDTQEKFFRLPIQEVAGALTTVGDSIAKRLQQSDEQRWSGLLRAWQHRDQGDQTQLLALIIGRDKATAAALIEEKVLVAPKSFHEAANDNDELRIAARMAGAMPVNQIKAVVEKIRGCRPTEASKLSSTAKAAVVFLKSGELESAKPYVQGYEVARWFRRQSGMSSYHSVNPNDVLQRLGVDVRVTEFEMRGLDAIAVWGTKHGPAVLLNKKSERVRALANIWSNGSIRVTAAHELCHFLLDSEHTLSAVDVLGGRMPLPVEQRARAFAAEFLLPRTEACALWQRMGSPLDLEAVRKVIQSLCRKFQVTESIAAWQLQHGTPDFHQEVLAQVLDQIVPHR